MAAWREQPPTEGGGGRGERPIVVQALRARSVAQRVILWTFAVIVTLAVAVVVAMLVLTGTDWGRERVRRFAQNSLNGMIHGKATIGRLSGNLLVGMTVHDLTITDSAGTPFIAVESFRGDYSIAALLRKRIWINHAVAVRPLVVLDKRAAGPLELAAHLSARHDAQAAVAADAVGGLAALHRTRRSSTGN